MPTLTLLCDEEALLRSWAGAQSDLTALVGSRIYSTTPKNAASKFPFVRMWRIGGQPPSSRPLWIDQPRVQVDCFGGPKALAKQIALTMQALLATTIVGAHAEGVVTDAQIGSLSYLPDSTFDPPQPRYTFDVVLTTHPLPA